jgi:predicted NBD/HSP70 family sugar kinase
MAELFEAAQKGDRTAIQAVDETASLIGIAVANAGSVVDPSLIVLGGALFAQAEPLVHEVRKVVGRIAPAPVQIVLSALGQEAPLSGSLFVAAREAREQLRQRFGRARAGS